MQLNSIIPEPAPTQEESEEEDEIRIGLYEAIEKTLRENPEIPTPILYQIAKLLADAQRGPLNPPPLNPAPLKRDAG